MAVLYRLACTDSKALKRIGSNVLVEALADRGGCSRVNWEPCSSPLGKRFACSAEHSLMLQNKRETQEKQMEN